MIVTNLLLFICASAEGPQLRLTAVAQPLDNAGVPLYDGGLFANFGTSRSSRCRLWVSTFPSQRPTPRGARPRVHRVHAPKENWWAALITRTSFSRRRDANVVSLLLKSKLFKKILKVSTGPPGKVIGRRDLRIFHLVNYRSSYGGQEGGTGVSVTDVRLRA